MATFGRFLVNSRRGTDGDMRFLDSGADARSTAGERADKKIVACNGRWRVLAKLESELD